jgi:PKD repeat protein
MTLRRAPILIAVIVLALGVMDPLMAAVPKASFTFTPAAPVTGQTVTFTDTSTGSPTAWLWNFGDGATSTLRNPTHVYATAGRFTVTLRASNASGSNKTSRTVTVSQAASTTFTGNIVLGSPTWGSITANVFAPDQSGTVYLRYGTASNAYTNSPSELQLRAGVPLEIPVTGLYPYTQYFYRLAFKASGASTFTPTTEYTFRTSRHPADPFTFTIQGDSHPEREKTQFSGDLYRRTLLTAAADGPDFHIALGDDFSVDTLDSSTITEAQVIQRYTLQRPYLGLIGASAPMFLVNGNHEQAARYLLNGTPDSVAVWAQNARNAHYAEPAPDGSFYTGNLEEIPYINGPLRNYYAWTWGDALFVVIDPYWSSPVCVDSPFGGGTKRSNLWDITHGDAQYQWLKATLEGSQARYKFVFAHHVLGTQRGGIELAGGYEWGGSNKDGTWGFTKNRPAWPLPLHQLMAANHVTIFFQGHDHIWVHQQLDGVVYQTLSEPADPYYALYNADAYKSGEKFPNTGYTRVTVAPTGVTVDYVRTYLPADEGPGRTNGSVAFRYVIQ